MDEKLMASPGQCGLVECHALHQKVAGSIPGQGMYPGFKFYMWEAAIWCFSISLPLCNNQFLKNTHKKTCDQMFTGITLYLS